MNAELHPHVVIFANDVDNYGVFSQYLCENDFPSQIFADPNEFTFNDLRPGTVFFISFNLKSTDVTALVRRIEKMRMYCIVFAENEDFQTAAQLGSAKMPQTLQYPYTQKNFLMAMQTLVRKRKEQFEKEIRQRQHHERQKGPKLEAAEAKNDGPRLFKSDSENKDSGFIIQEGIENHARTTTHIQGDAAPAIASIMQKGTKGSSFFIIQKGEAPPEPTQREPLLRVANTKKAHAEETLQYGPLKEDPTPTSQPSAALQVAPKEEQARKAPEAEFTRNREYKSLRAELMGEYWAILAVVAVGTAVCGYCLYLTLFS